MLINKRSSLKKTYYKSFLGVIVIPILLILSLSLKIIGVIVQDSAVDSLLSAQEKIVYNLTTSIQDASLQLSHFVYVNDGQFMGLAADSDAMDVETRYVAQKNLSRAFQIAMLPKQGVISSMFYMKDGKSVYLKDEIQIPMNQLQKSAWYQRALKNKNTVMIGGYDTSQSKLTYTGRTGGELILVAALSPDNSVDRSNKIEIASIFTTTKAGEMIQNFDQKQKDGITTILDETGKVLFGNRKNEDAISIFSQWKEQGEGVFEKKIELRNKGHMQYTFIVSKEPITGWKVITGVPTFRLTQGLQMITITVLLIIVFILLLFYLFSSYFLKNIIEPVHRMVGGLHQVEAGNLDTHLEPGGQKEIREMMHSFNYMTYRLKSSIRESEEERQKKHEAEMRALQSQINPHFLVNSLNSIRFMAQVSKYDGIRKMAEAMIQILTCSFRSNSSMYTVREELDVLDSFIYLMKIRYSNGFDVTYHVDEACMDYWIPRLILQPIVENSIVHGFENTGEDIGHLEITVRHTEDSVFFEVLDDGIGISEDRVHQLIHPQRKKQGDNYNIGVENVYTRLKLHFGDAFEMQVDSKVGLYTKIILSLPICTEEETEHE